MSTSPFVAVLVQFKAYFKCKVLLLSSQTQNNLTQGFRLATSTKQKHKNMQVKLGL